MKAREKNGKEIIKIVRNKEKDYIEVFFCLKSFAASEIEEIFKKIDFSSLKHLSKEKSESRQFEMFFIDSYK